VTGAATRPIGQLSEGSNPAALGTNELGTMQHAGPLLRQPPINVKEQALTAAAGLHLMPNVSYRGAPGMMAALAGVVHERQTAAG
jgi:hypothetical protein